MAVIMSELGWSSCLWEDQSLASSYISQVVSLFILLSNTKTKCDLKIEIKLWYWDQNQDHQSFDMDGSIINQDNDILIIIVINK